jgi:transposase-like protein
MMMTEGNMFDQRLLKRINEPQAVVVDELQGNKALIAECKKAVEESKESIKKLVINSILSRTGSL